MYTFLLEPWPWYVSGPMIALVLYLLLASGKQFGMSSNLRTLCTLCGADRLNSFFDFDWKYYRWNLIVAFGAGIGGFIGHYLLSDTSAVAISSETITHLNLLGFTDAGESYLPAKLFGPAAFHDPYIICLLAIGGFLVGFGARYAGGCTSGHAISGLSNLQLPSLIAVVGFFIGGLIMVHFILPFLF